MQNKYLKLYNEYKEIKSREKDYTERILIIDFMNTFRRAFSISPEMNKNGTHVGGITGFIKSMGSAIRSTLADKCIIVSDGVGGSYHRRKLYPDYKKGRKHSNKYNRAYNFLNDEDENEAKKSQIYLLKKYLDILPVIFMQYDKTEADDVIAYLSTDIFTDSEIIIMSTDKDFLQLVDGRIKVWSPSKKVMYETPDEVFNDYNIYPINFVTYRAIIGDDTSDNIIGIKNIADKKIYKYYSFLTENKFYDTEKILRYAKKMNEEKSLQVYKNLVDDEDRFLLNYKLMNLKEPMISATTQLTIQRKLENIELNPIDRSKYDLLNMKNDLVDVMPDRYWLNKTFYNIESKNKFIKKEENIDGSRLLERIWSVFPDEDNN